jgi:hypothetical protein
MSTPDGPRPPFVPDDFAVPRELVAGEFRLEPLGPQHNAGDYEAWTSSMEHIRATPGFAGWGWPKPMTPDDNLGDLRRHAEDFAARKGFTYTVLADGDRVVGACTSTRRRTARRVPPTCAPGSAPTVPNSTSHCTTRCRLGWRSRGRSRSCATPTGDRGWPAPATGCQNP